MLWTLLVHASHLRETPEILTQAQVVISMDVNLPRLPFGERKEEGGADTG